MRPSCTTSRPVIRFCRNSRAAQVSIEAAQPKLDLKMLEKLPSKTIILGVIDLSDLTVETPEVVAERIRKALPYVPAERIVIAPDCGMKYLPRDVAFGKMQAMVRGADIVPLEQFFFFNDTATTEIYTLSLHDALPI